MKRFLLLMLALLALLVPVTAWAEEDGESDGAEVYSLVDESGTLLTQRSALMYVDDEYISGDNKLYRVISVDGENRTAIAQLVGDEPMETNEVTTAFSAAQPGKKLICMYATHSDESYVPNDGTSSKLKNAGIYDVTEALKQELEAQGIDVILDETTHHPHDAGAYKRSRQTAVKLLKNNPAALLDIHRDGVPAEEYAKTIDGEKASKVRLLVGRSNQNADANRAFAKQIKAQADKEYPGLIKDIFIGKGNYNQELFPKAILLEFGTHELDKDRAITSTKYMAEVLNNVLFGGSAKAAPAPDTNGAQNSQNSAAAKNSEDNGAGAKGIFWVIGLAVLGAAIYALIATGTFSGIKEKFSRGTSEITGGLVGKKPEDEEDDSSK